MSIVGVGGRRALILLLGALLVGQQYQNVETKSIYKRDADEAELKSLGVSRTAVVEVEEEEDDGSKAAADEADKRGAKYPSVKKDLEDEPTEAPSAAESASSAEEKEAAEESTVAPAAETTVAPQSTTEKLKKAPVLPTISAAVGTTVSPAGASQPPAATSAAPNKPSGLPDGDQLVDPLNHSSHQHPAEANSGGAGAEPHKANSGAKTTVAPPPSSAPSTPPATQSEGESETKNSRASMDLAENDGPEVDSPTVVLTIRGEKKSKKPKAKSASGTTTLAPSIVMASNGTNFVSINGTLAPAASNKAASAIKKSGGKLRGLGGFLSGKINLGLGQNASSFSSILSNSLGKLGGAGSFSVNTGKLNKKTGKLTLKSTVKPSAAAAAAAAAGPAGAANSTGAANAGSSSSAANSANSANNSTTSAHSLRAPMSLRDKAAAAAGEAAAVASSTTHAPPPSLAKADRKAAAKGAKKNKKKKKSKGGKKTASKAEEASSSEAKNATAIANSLPVAPPAALTTLAPKAPGSAPTPFPDALAPRTTAVPKATSAAPAAAKTTAAALLPVAPKSTSTAKPAAKTPSAKASAAPTSAPSATSAPTVAPSETPAATTKAAATTAAPAKDAKKKKKSKKTKAAKASDKNSSSSNNDNNNSSSTNTTSISSSSNSSTSSNSSASGGQSAVGNTKAKVATAGCPIEKLKNMKESDKLLAVVMTAEGSFKGRKLNAKAVASLMSGRLTQSQLGDINAGKAIEVSANSTFAFPPGHYFFPQPIRFAGLASP